MSVGQIDTFVIGGSLMTINALGSSVFPTKITPPINSWGGQLKIASGTSVEILPNQLANKNIAGATATGLGYFLGTSEIYQFNGPASFYIATANATAVIALSFNFSSGATLA